MKQVILKESDLWDNYEYHLKAEQFAFNVEFKTEEGDFVAKFKKPTRESKGLPHSEVSAKFTQRFYKREGLKIPKTLCEMRQILKIRSDNLSKGIL